MLRGAALFKKMFAEIEAAAAATGGLLSEKFVLFEAPC